MATGPIQGNGRQLLGYAERVARGVLLHRSSTSPDDEVWLGHTSSRRVSLRLCIPTFHSQDI